MEDAIGQLLGLLSLVGLWIGFAALARVIAASDYRLAACKNTRIIGAVLFLLTGTLLAQIPAAPALIDAATKASNIGRHAPTTLPDRMDRPRSKVVPIDRVVSDRSTVVLARAPGEFDVSDSDPVQKKTGIHTQAINLDSANSAILFPVAGNAAGAGGTYFRSDITVANYRSVDQRVAIFWLAAGQNNSASLPTYVTISANSVRSFRDFVGTFLGKSGLGAIVVKAVTASGSADALGQLDGSSRIYTPPPGGGSGSLSQMFPAVAFEDVPAGSSAIALGLRHDSQFRTNAGVVNLDVVPHTWTVSAVGDVSREFTITVQPFSLQQVSIPTDSYGDVFLEFSSTSPTWWSAYAASVDNTTGDSWSAHAATVGASTPANADVTGTWDATLIIGGDPYDATLSMVQTGTSITGTAAIVGFGAGSLSGTVTGQSLDFTINEITPCAGTFSGSATIGTGSQTLSGGTASGSDCYGFYSATITATKTHSAASPPANTANVTGTWNTTLTIVGLGQVAASVTFVQNGTNVTGTGAITGAGWGSITGSVSGHTLNFTITEFPLCPGTFVGTATISADNRSATGSGSGSDCTGSFTATIAGTKL